MSTPGKPPSYARFLEAVITSIAKGLVEVREVDGQIEFNVTDKGEAVAITKMQQEIEI